MYGVGGSGTAGLAEIYAMRKNYKENMKKKIEAAAAAAAAKEDKYNVVEKKKIGEMKKPKKSLQTNSRVSSVDI
ncbi:hypothetical protein BRARA_C02571 [Brassica rapa]|uniref:Uncharacterized protein n=1 Tax=Brassica campestris TaxID=3711 RepID=A0A397ZYA5_BRACM|nr:uncharacterized protein BNAA03G57110D [Brassica napus]RID70559.1 hypothetical protein BRARA_C02571 [Brassica rapa]CAG7881489.1 unnamed protein product [Brassica rapa]VDC80809.1 unnamed protein product [Brassica rapa]